MKLVRIAVILMFAVLAAPAAHAAEPTIDEKVATIIDIAVPPGPLLSGPFPGTLLLAPIDGIAEAYQSAARSRVQEILLAEMDAVRTRQRRQLASVLISVFSKEEIDALFAFLSSPTGRSIAAKRQIFGAEMSAALAGEETANYTEFQKAVAADPEIQRLRQLSQSSK